MNRRKFLSQQIPNFAQLQQQYPLEKFVEARINAGMIVPESMDPADIPPESLRYIKNGQVRYDKTSRRPGSVLYTPSKPDSNPVQKFLFVKLNDGTTRTVRFTHTSLFSLEAGVWVSLAGTLAGTATDRIQSVLINDKLVFTNNGLNEVQLINFGSHTFAKLGNAPKYRYLTGFSNRIVGAAIPATNEVQIGWCADAGADNTKLAVWDSATDESAGSSPLVDSPSDLSDFITGLFAFTNVMVVMREKSVWLATKQPIASAPFYFYSAIPGTGCDAPNSICISGNSLTWFDSRTASVYNYTPGGSFEPIGRFVEAAIIKNIKEPKQIFSAYDPIPQEYSLCIPQLGSKYVSVWTYNFRNKAWTFNQYYDIFGFDAVDTSGGMGLTIDQLGDVPVDNLTGTIEQLVGSSTYTAPARYIGRGDGTLCKIDINTDIDAPHADYPNGVEYDTVMESKTFNVPETDLYIAQVNIEYQARRGGSFTLAYSIDGGKTYIDAKTFTPTVLDIPRLLILHRVIKARRFSWRLTATKGLFDLMSYEVYVIPAGKSTK